MKLENQIQIYADYQGKVLEQNSVKSQFPKMLNKEQKAVIKYCTKLGGK